MECRNELFIIFFSFRNRGLTANYKLGVTEIHVVQLNAGKKDFQSDLVRGPVPNRIRLNNKISGQLALFAVCVFFLLFHFFLGGGGLNGLWYFTDGIRSESSV